MVYYYAGKADLSKVYWNLKRKLEGFFFFFFLNQIEALLSLKNAWLPPIFFLNTKSTC